MRSKAVSAVITYRDSLGIDYRICRIDQIDFENGEFRYEFRPMYNVIDLLPTEFEGIPGLDLELRNEVYVRENLVPVFIAERVPPRNRENIHDELAEVGLQYYDALEWLLRTDRRYFGDTLHVIRTSENDIGRYDVDSNSSSMAEQCRALLEAAGSGREIFINGIRQEPQQLRSLVDFARSLLRNEMLSKIRNPVGRRAKEIDPFDLEEVCTDIAKGRISLEEGLETLGISRATFYRRMKQFGLSI